MTPVMGPLFTLNWLLVQAQEKVPAGFDNHMAFDRYASSAITVILIAAFLISVLLIGAGVVLNFTLLSKRPEDHIGGRYPGEVSIFHDKFPETPYSQHEFPAEDEDPKKPEAA